ncbi:MAG: hypothetical protein JW839_09625 [Candidatus Lokiarchaeota archaeon]|nr:hypothetical protein [Candidatus Lokiarchaeota archaeon]
MVRGSSEVFKKLKALTVLSAVLLSGIVMSCGPSIPTPADGSPSAGGGTTAESYADIGRPSFLVPGRYLDYSVSYGLIPGSVNQSTSNLTANLRYQFNSISGENYSITEQTTDLHVSYGFTLPGPVMGFYNTGVANATVVAEQYRGYSSAGPIKASVINSTNFGSNYSFTTTLDMYASNGSFRRATGNGTNQVVVDSLLPLGSPGRGSFFGYYRTILSYYKSLSTLWRAPKALYTVRPGFAVDGTTSIATYMGTRSAVKVVHNVLNAPPVLNGTYIDLKWQDILYFDVYTGALIKAVMYVDNKINDTVAIKFHQLEFNLVDTNLDFGTPGVSPQNTYEDGMYDVVQYLASSALNDTNRSLFHHAAVGGATAPSNSTKLTADTFKILFGYGSALGYPLETLFLELNSSRLRDADAGGFYRSMDAAGTAVDGVKTVTDAAWAIIGSSVLGSAALKFQEDMFHYMKDNHYGNGSYSGLTFHAFARYNATSDPFFYAYDNLVAFLALNWLAFYTNSTLKAEAKSMAYRIISLFSGTASYPGFLNNTLFVESIDRNGLFAATERSVLDAFLAIYALSQYYVFNQSVQAKAHVDRAIAAFHKLLSRAWNATNKGFIHELQFDLSPKDTNQHLEDNAWALVASLSLLEAANHAYSAVDNITYYDVACDTWAAIKKVLYDSQNETFRAASNNQASHAGDLGILLYSLSGMLSVSRSTTITLATNATGNQFVYERLKPVKAIATWKLEMAHELPSPLAKITTVIPLNYSDVHFKIRYSNKTIYDEMFSVTDNAGVATFTFPLPTPPEFTDMDPARKSATAHLIGVVANRTGFEPTEALREFYVTSAISVWTDPKNPGARFEFTGNKFTAYFNNRTEPESVPSIYPGETFTVSINMSNSLAIDQNVTITFEGDIIDTNSSTVTVNASAVNATYALQLTARGNIPTEMQAMNFSISKNGSAILAGEIPVYVKIPVVLTNLIYSAYMVDDSNYSLTFNVKNLNKNRNESVTLTFSSVNLELTSGAPTFNVTDIEPDQEFPAALAFRRKADASILAVYEFSIKLSWGNVSLGTLSYLIPFRAPIEVVAISGPTAPVQGGLLLFALSLRNNLPSAASVKVSIYRVLNTGDTAAVNEVTVTLATGSNNFVVSCKDPLENPWDLGAREYRVVVQRGEVEVGRETVVANVNMSLENTIFAYVVVFGAFGLVFLWILNKKRQLDRAQR